MRSSDSSTSGARSNLQISTLGKEYSAGWPLGTPSTRIMSPAGPGAEAGGALRLRSRLVRPGRAAAALACSCRLTLPSRGGGGAAGMHSLLGFSAPEGGHKQVQHTLKLTAIRCGAVCVGCHQPSGFRPSKRQASTRLSQLVTPSQHTVPLLLHAGP